MTSNVNVNAMLTIRDTLMRQGPEASKIISPATTLKIVEEMSGVPMSRVEGLCNQHSMRIRIPANQDFLIEMLKNNGRSTQERVEVLYLSSYFNARRSKLLTEEIRHKLDFRMTSKHDQSNQIHALSRLGFYKSMLSTYVMTDRLKDDVDARLPFTINASTVKTSLMPEEIERRYGKGIKSVPIEDDWSTGDGNTKKYPYRAGCSKEDRYEGSVVLAALFIALGKNALRDELTLMRGAQVFKVYKILRQNAPFIERPVWSAPVVFKFCNDITVGRSVIMHDCKCGMYYFDPDIRLNKQCIYCQRNTTG